MCVRDGERDTCTLHIAAITIEICEHHLNTRKCWVFFPFPSVQDWILYSLNTQRCDLINKLIQNILQ